MKKRGLKVKAITCRKCNCTIFSRARHDYRNCECGAIAIDGGFDYIKINGNPSDIKEWKPIEIEQTVEELYKDWAEKTDKYGLIKGK